MRKKDYSIFTEPILYKTKKKNDSIDYYQTIKKKNWFTDNITFFTVIRKANEYGIRSYEARW